MIPRPRASLAPAVAVLALTGVWLTHVLEYLRTVPRAHVGEVAAASIHAYMVPVGGLLAIGAGLAGGAVWRAWARAGARIDGARAAIGAALRGGIAAAAPARSSTAGVPSFSGGLLALWLPVAALQVLLYLGQENAEASLAGLPRPGLGALSGAHWAAPLIHLGVAGALAAAVCLASRLLGARLRRASTCERLLDAVLHARLRPRSVPVPAAVWRPSPLRLAGRRVWARPPPAAAAA